MTEGNPSVPLLHYLQQLYPGSRGEHRGGERTTSMCSLLTNKFTDHFETGTGADKTISTGKRPAEYYSTLALLFLYAYSFLFTFICTIVGTLI